MCVYLDMYNERMNLKWQYTYKFLPENVWNALVAMLLKYLRRGNVKYLHEWMEARVKS